jgi:type II secretory pathway predicted ATPase ExeA/septal ring-binding cell division protein DamX
MYYAHFGLTQAPFRITPNTEFFFAGGNRGPILDALIYAVVQGEGIIKVTGEVGSGKTMLCNMLQSRLPPQVETVYIANPSVSPEEILQAVAFELQLTVGHEAGRLEVMQALHNYLLDRYAQHKQVVVFVEESQTAPLATLEEIRLLSNLETQQHKLLQIVLFGQPELEDNLRQPNIRQLRERITHSFSLHPLSAQEIGSYLMFRLRAAGYRGPDLFNPAVIKQIAKASGGLTRRVNLIADKTLLAAFSENTHTIRLRHVEAAVRDSEFARDDGRRKGRRLALGISLIAVGAGLGAMSYSVYQTHFPKRVDNRAAAVDASGNAPSAVGNPPAQNAAAPALPAQAAAVPALPAPIAATQAPGTAPPAGASTPVSAPVTVAPTTASQHPAAEATQTAKPSGAEAPATAALAPVEAAAKPAIIRRRPDADALDKRLLATTEWLQQRSKATYSIQVLGTDNAEQLKQHLNIIAKFVEINNIFVYRTIAKQKPFLTVLYGSFENRKDAQEALTKLPAQLRAYRPYLRTVQGIRSEIDQHRDS